MRTNVGTGDKGITSLLSGERVPKTHVRVEACGDLDELASVLGALASSLPVAPADAAAGVKGEIAAIQEELLRLGAWVAATAGSPAAAALRPPAEEPVRRLEQATQRCEQEAPPQQGFLLPGGSLAASWAHVARSVCRRAERRVAAVPSPETLPFLNRLSTYLYALARWLNHQEGITETVWKP
ncbi:MAG TPA: cob(I)yrinic acid a,c-diamide adenosyltransferase [Spirochaetia bacterium]|nr:cob(I)yrinic acid a,c-diamide adenosyltransferase [Spirochaetia bacterium]